MKNYTALSPLFFLVVLSLLGCSSSSDDDSGSGAASGTRVIGAVSGTASSLVKSVALLPKIAVYNDDPALCPDETGGGVSETISPSSYTVALKQLTLIGDAGTDDYELFSADSVDEAYIADFVDDLTFFSTESYPTAGTYTGIEIELFYIEMEVPMIIPAIDAAETTYITRGYFDEVGSVLPRDVTVFSEGAEYWINRETTDPASAYELYAVSAGRPVNVLDLWSDEDFWGTEEDPRDPLTICTTDTETCDVENLGTDFTFEMADDSGTLTIPDSTSGLYTITMTFNVADKFTFWEYLENGLSSDADGSFTVGYDCGYRILFPNVEISVEGSE